VKRPINVTGQARVRGWRAAAVAGAGIYLGWMVAAATVIYTGASTGSPVPGLGIAVFSFAALGLAWWAVARSVDRRTRSAWIWIASGITLLSISGVLLNTVHSAGFPRPADIPRLLMVPVMLTGLLRLPTHAQTGRTQRLKLALDAGTAAAAAAIFLWYAQVSPAVAGPGVTAQRIVAATAYPLGDVLLIFGIAVVLTRGVDAASRRPMLLLAVASVPWIIGDTSVVMIQPPRAGGAPGATWQLLCFITAHFLLAAAAFEQCRRGVRRDLLVEHTSVTRVSRLPYVAVASGFGLMLFVAAREDVLYPWGGLVLCATVLTALVAVRQALAQRENHRMAVTDGLTGLANRARLHDALSLALVRGAGSGYTTGVLMIDLNGFKQINDTLGHEAGDKLLIAFGEMVRRSILGSDIAGRLGGDEFAVVLNDIGTAHNAEAVAQRIVHETTQRIMLGDTVVQVRSSIGIALSGPGELGVDEVLHHADVAMYQAKAGSRVTGASGWQHHDPLPGRADRHRPRQTDRSNR
jgi:diguanylate cyclase (GGDEF)-like protein